jgi:hypothetical protein
MDAPQNYIIPQANPFAATLQGVQAGEGLNAIAQKQIDQQRLQAAQLKMQTDFNALANNPNASGADYSRMMALYPQMSEQLKRGYDVLDQSQKDSQVAHASQVYSALSAGKPEIAMQVLDDQIKAYTNSGNTAAAKSSEFFKQLITTSPETARTSAGLLLSATMGADKFASNFSTIDENLRKEELHAPDFVMKKNAAELKKYAADNDLTSANVDKAIMESKHLGAETAKIYMEMEQLKKNGGLKPQDRFDFEDRLRKEYVSRSTNYVAAQDAAAKIQASAADHSGAGDIALVTSFMKMLDPGSVVRETEFDTARDTAGLLAKLSNSAEKLKNGAFLDDKQRADFSRLAGAYMGAADKQQAAVRRHLTKTADRYGLDPANIFPEETPGVKAAPSQAVQAPFPPQHVAPGAAPTAPAAPAGAFSATTQGYLDKYLPKP